MYSSPSGAFEASWSLDETTGVVTFTLGADLAANQWLAMGFNAENRMVWYFLYSKIVVVFFFKKNL